MEQAFAQSIDKVARQVGADLEHGIAEKDVAKRQHKFGKNRLRRHRTRSAIGILASQLKSLVVWPRLGGRSSEQPDDQAFQLTGENTDSTSGSVAS